MCVSPSHICLLRGPKYEQQPVPCKVCWRCLSNRVGDYVGRALCEAHNSLESVALTLTYAPRGDLADKVLTPHHFQAFIRSLRRRGHLLRYVVAGEYGELKGRAHFHTVLFFKRFADGSAPAWPQHKNFHIDEWPHGHVYADWNADDKAMRYVCKYILKSAAKGEGWFSLSKKPALGAEYFQSLAERYADLGTWPRSFEYKAPNGRNGKTYLLSGASRRDFLQTLVARLGPPDPQRVTEWTQLGLEKLWRYELQRSPVLINDEAFMAEMTEELADRQAKAAREHARREADRLSDRLDRDFKRPLPDHTDWQ